MGDVHNTINKAGVELATQNAQPLSLLNKIIRIYKGET
jgi:hypothetical protein